MQPSDISVFHIRNQRLTIPLCCHDRNLVESFLSTLHETGADFTNCFRHLSELPLPSAENFAEEKLKVLKYLQSQSSSLEELMKANQPRMDRRYVQA